MPLVSFEGLDASGKSTLIRVVAERLAHHGPLVLREPGGTLLGDQMRALVRGGAGAEPTPTAELMLFAAARSQLIHERIRPALLEGRLVLIDRFTDSTVAYQAYGREMDLDGVLRIVRMTADGIVPHLTIWIDVPEAVRLKRLQSRGATDRFERAGRPFDQRVAAGYAAICRAEPERVLRVDGARDVDALADAVCAALAARAIAT